MKLTAMRVVWAAAVTAMVLWASGVIPAIIPAAVPAASKQGNGAKFQLSTGSTTTNNCVKFDANGNTVDAGGACAVGGGTGTVSSGTQFQVAQYTGAGTTTTVAGVSIPNCIDTGGQHVNFTSGTGAFSCGSSGGGAGAAALPNIRQTAFAGAQSLATTINAISGDYLIVLAGNNNAITGISDTQSNTYTQIDTGTVSGNVGKMWFTHIGSSAALTVTWTGTGSFANTTLLEFTGPAGFAGTLDSHGTVNGSSGSAAITMTATQTNELVFVGAVFDHSGDVAQYPAPLFPALTGSGGGSGGSLAYGLLQTAQAYLLNVLVPARSDYVVTVGVFK